MKRNLTLAEQKERETLASRVYAATVSLDAAKEAYENCRVLERRDWHAYANARDRFLADVRSCEKDAVQTARMVWQHSDRCLELAAERMAEAESEREDALEAEKDFRTRMDARPALACAYCEAEAEIVREDEALCGPCDAKLQAEWDAMMAEQERDYNAGISGGLHRDR